MLSETAYDQIKYLVIGLDSNYTIQYVTDSWLKAKKYNREEVVGSSILKFGMKEKQISEALTDTTYIELLDGENKICPALITASKDKENQYLFVYFTDLSDDAQLERFQHLLHREAEVKALRNNLDLLSQYSPVGLWKMDNQGILIWANYKSAQILETNIDTLLDSYWLDYVHPDDKKKALTTYKKMINKDTDVDITWRVNCDFEKWVHIIGSPLQTQEGGFVGTISDITAETKLIEELKSLKYNF